MSKIRVAQNEVAYFLGFEPPLQSDQLLSLPNPYGKYKNGETAGWPASAVVSRPEAVETVIGIYKDSLVMKCVYSGTKLTDIDKERQPGDELVAFLGKTLHSLDGGTLDPRLYEIETEGNLINFILPDNDTSLGL